jgi:hypothetical protein
MDYIHYGLTLKSAQYAVVATNCLHIVMFTEFINKAIISIILLLLRRCMAMLCYLDNFVVTFVIHLIQQIIVLINGRIILFDLQAAQNITVCCKIDVLRS